MAVASMPSRLRTRATLMPPPPGSRCAGAQRILVKGSIFVTDVETSTAGLMVRVTMEVRGISANDVGLRQGTQADEGDVFFEDEIGRNRFKIVAKAPFVLETGPELRAGEIFGHATQNAAGNEYSAGRAQREREIAGDRPEHRAEHVDGGAAGRTAALDPGPGDLGGVASRQCQIVEGGEGIVKIFQPVA